MQEECLQQKDVGRNVPGSSSCGSKIFFLPRIQLLFSFRVFVVCERFFKAIELLNPHVRDLIFFQ